MSELAITMEGYEFKELSDKAKEKVMADHFEHGLAYEWWDDVYETAKEDGDARGFEIDDIRFSGFSSQGDGASWTGRVRVGRYLDWKIPQMLADDPDLPAYTVLREFVENTLLIISIEISRGGGMYVHEGTMRCDMDSHDFGSTDPDEWGDITLHNGVLAGARVADLLDAYAFDKVIDNLIQKSFEDAKDYAREIYRQLEKEYDWLTSEEVFAELADANDWRFDESGDFL